MRAFGLVGLVVMLISLCVSEETYIPEFSELGWNELGCAGLSFDQVWSKIKSSPSYTMGYISDPRGDSLCNIVPKYIESDNTIIISDERMGNTDLLIRPEGAYCILDLFLYKAMLVCRDNGFVVGCLTDYIGDEAFLFLRSDKDCRC